jgi:hypothetical protein
MPVSTAELSYASLGGKPIISIRSAIEAFTENGWDLSRFMGKANSFTNSIGEEPGRGYVLMAADTLNTLNTSTPLNLVFGQGGSDESIELQGIYIRTATRITPGASQSTGAIFLVELVDTRYYLQRKLINKRYNCRYLRDTSSSYVTATTNSGTPWTWSQVITDLWNANSTLIGGIGTLPGLTDLTSKPENLRYEGVPAWEALNDACRRCGCTVVLDNAFVNNFFVVRLGVIAGDTAPSFFNAGGTNITKLGAEATFSASPTPRITGDGIFSDAEVLQGDSMIPKTIVVMFPTEFGGSQIRDELESTYGKWYPIKIDGSDSAVLPYHVACEFHDTPGDGRRIPRPNFNSGSELIRYELTTARFSSATDVDPSNKTDLTTRAKEIARDIYRTIHDCAIAHVGYMGVKFGADANPVIAGKTLTSVSWGDFGQGFRTDFYRSIPRLLPDVPYLIPQPGGGGGAQLIQFAITSVDCDAGTATGTVTDVLCSGAESEIGDIIELADPLSLLAGNPLIVEGRTGIAVKMSDDGLYGSCIYKIINTEDLGTNCA